MISFWDQRIRFRLIVLNAIENAHDYLGDA